MALLSAWSQDRSQVLSLVRQTLCLPSHLLSTLVPISNHSRLYCIHISCSHTQAVYTTLPTQNRRASIICLVQTEGSYISGHPLNFSSFKQETRAPQHTKLCVNPLQSSESRDLNSQLVAAPVSADCRVHGSPLSFMKIELHCPDYSQVITI